MGHSKHAHESSCDDNEQESLGCSAAVEKGESRKGSTTENPLARAAPELYEELAATQS
jgi:hypothetical protein